MVETSAFLSICFYKGCFPVSVLLFTHLHLLIIGLRLSLYPRSASDSQKPMIPLLLIQNHWKEVSTQCDLQHSLRFRARPCNMPALGKECKGCQYVSSWVKIEIIIVLTWQGCQENEIKSRLVNHLAWQLEHSIKFLIPTVFAFNQPPFQPCIYPGKENLLLVTETGPKIFPKHCVN